LFLFFIFYFGFLLHSELTKLFNFVISARRFHIYFFVFLNIYLIIYYNHIKSRAELTELCNFVNINLSNK